MRKEELIDGISDLIAIIMPIGLFILICTFIYKLFSGVYHLLDKLIDKI